MIHAKINTIIKQLGVMLTGILLAVPLIGAAAPNARSEADIAVCREDDATARVCSSKELSNVVLQCAGDPVFHKVDDLDDTENPFPGLVSPYEGLFTCPDGNIVAVFVKSGSKKYIGDLIGLPRGSGAVFGPGECPVVCPVPRSEDEEEVGDGGIPTDEIPQ